MFRRLDEADAASSELELRLWGLGHWIRVEVLFRLFLFLSPFATLALRFLLRSSLR